MKADNSGLGVDNALDPFRNGTWAVARPVDEPPRRAKHHQGYLAEQLGRPLISFGAFRPGMPSRRRYHLMARSVGSWLVWGGYRRLREHPLWYLESIIDRRCKMLAVRWYPETGDWDDCEACAITDDFCIFHKGGNNVASYVVGRLPELLNEKPLPADLLATLFPNC